MIKRVGWGLFFLYSMILLVFAIVETMILGTFVTLITFFSNRQNFVYRVGKFWARLNLLLSGVRVEVSGLEHLQADQPYVVMANHQSYYDVWALIGFLPMQLRWVIKAELRKVPLFGLGCERMGHFFIHRGANERAIKSLQKAASRIRSGTAVFFFPEGTRSPDGALLPLKPGGFQVAMQAGVPILPVTINGGGDVLPKGTIVMRPGPIQIVIHPPVTVPQGDQRDQREQRKALMQQISKIISGALQPQVRKVQQRQWTANGLSAQ